MDVSDIDFETLKSLLTLYILFEKALFNYHGADRESNIYCVPYYHAPIDMRTLSILDLKNLPPSVTIRVLGNGDNEQIKNRGVVSSVSNGTKKYSALNLMPIRTQGSIEFRHAASTKDMKVVIEWIHLLMLMKKAAMNTTAEGVLAMLYAEGPTALGKRVFGPLYSRLSYARFDEGVENSLHLAKEVSKGLSIEHTFDTMRGEEVCDHPGFRRHDAKRDKYWEGRKTPHDKEYVLNNAIDRLRHRLGKKQVTRNLDVTFATTINPGMWHTTPPNPVQDMRTWDIPTVGGGEVVVRAASLEDAVRLAEGDGVEVNLEGLYNYYNGETEV
jgi:hypothetical protein